MSQSLTRAGRALPGGGLTRFSGRITVLPASRRQMFPTETDAARNEGWAEAASGRAFGTRDNSRRTLSAGRLYEKGFYR
ncbi:hypothetical protein, partial [Treponema endosymbiont of Eucomonympha sp.]|uniref:hypothetical protein n=1 Tax=Treponema endosymbiont of Eucomonympha sp. TaxID=1580831 RepID=UPI001EE71CAB